MKVNCHTFNVDLAVEVGLNQAIILQHLFYWHQVNEKNKNNIIEGRIWTYSSVAQINLIFPYLSVRQIAHTFKKLESEGFILTGNFNKFAFDNTKWYSLTDKSLDLYASRNVKAIHETSNDNSRNVNAIPDNKTNSKIVVTAESKSSEYSFSDIPSKEQLLEVKKQDNLQKEINWKELNLMWKTSEWDASLKKTCKVWMEYPLELQKEILKTVSLHKDVLQNIWKQDFIVNNKGSIAWLEDKIKSIHKVKTNRGLDRNLKNINSSIDPTIPEVIL
jgi:hypothetical protein